MSSVQTPANLQPDTPDSKTTGDSETIPVSVRIEKRLARLCRMAAAKLDTTRSQFMAEAAVEKARAVLELNREEDFRAWLEAA